MDIVEALCRMTDEGGLNIPQSTIAFYCDVSHSAISSYVTNGAKPSARIEGKLREGIGKYVKELETIRDGIRN